MNSIKKIISTTLVLIMLTAFLGCQKNPDVSAVVSKNDGSFDISVVQSSTTPQSGETNQTVSYHEQFTSTDGSVNFTMDIETVPNVNGGPVVKVQPHFLTGEDVQLVAYTLFGEDVSYYEARPTLGDTTTLYSQREIQSFLNRWSQYASQDALDTVFGTGSRNNVDTVKQFIEKYTEIYHSAPANTPQIPCEWTMKPDSVYVYSQADLETVDDSDRNLGIEAEFIYQNLPYRMIASTRNKNDFKINNISVSISPISPAGFDRDLLMVHLQNTDPPTEQIMENSKAEVSKWLEEMGLGHWQVDSCEKASYEFTEGGPELWSFTVRAVPVFEGVAAARREQLYNLKSKEAYASNYYMTDAEFQFNADGVLLDCNIYSPVDLNQVINGNAATLSTEELLARAKEHLSLSDAYAWGADPTSTVKQNANITIRRMEYGLTRVKVPNTDEQYYYVPGVTFWGSNEIVTDTGELWFNSENDYVLLILNAIDGSVVNSSGV